MTQNYNSLNETDELVDSRLVINNNTLTALTFSSSSSVPTTNVEDGRPFYNTTTDILYIRSNSTWKALFNLSGSVPLASDSEKLGGFTYSAYPRVAVKNVYAQNQVLVNNRALAVTNTGGTELNAVVLSASNSMQFGNTSVVPTIFYPSASEPLVHNGTSSYQIYHEGNPPPSVPIGSHDHDTEYLAIDGKALSSYDSDKLASKSLWASGNNYDVVTYVKTDGSLAIGNSLYFHESDGDTKLYSARLTQYYDNGTYPSAGFSLFPSTLSPTVSASLKFVCGDFNGDYGAITAIDTVNAGGRLNLGTSGTGQTNAISIQGPDTPGLGNGEVLTYSHGLSEIPVVEAWSFGAAAVLMSYNNVGGQTGFQNLTGSVDASYNGYVDFPDLSTIAVAHISSLVNTDSYVASHIKSIVGNRVYYKCSFQGTNNVNILAFGSK